MGRRIILVLVASLSLSIVARAQSSAFTYQGRLTDNGIQPTATYDMEFRLFDALEGGNPLPQPNPITVTFTDPPRGVAVANGVFTVQLDFGGAAAFDGGPRWLQIAVKKPADSSFVPLTPRQPITSTPYALRTFAATSADALSGACTLCVTDAHIQAVSGSKVTGTVANATTATQLYGSLASFDIGGSGHIAGTLRLEANGLNDPETPSLSLSANGSFKVDAPFLPGGRFTILPNGNVGIGNDAPSEKLDVVGNVKFTGTITGDGSGLTNLKVTGRNPQHIALLRWYDANLSLPPILVGGIARALAFDGTFMYVANFSGNYVTRIRASNGVVEGTAIPVGTSPNALAFDGTFMYVANKNSNTVTRIRATTGLVESTPIPVGSFPRALAFDGTFMYVASGDSVTRIRASTGLVEGTPIRVGSNAFALAFDGTFMYVANRDSDNVTRIRASTGVVEGTPIPVGSSPVALAFDGTFMYVANKNSNNVTRIRAGTEVVEGTPIPVESSPEALAFDGTFMYVTSGNTVTKF